MRLTIGMVRKGELWLSLLQPTFRIGKKRRDIHVHLLYFYVFIMRARRMIANLSAFLLYACMSVCMCVS